MFIFKETFFIDKNSDFVYVFKISEPSFLFNVLLKKHLNFLNFDQKFIFYLVILILFLFLILSVLSYFFPIFSLPLFTFCSYVFYHFVFFIKNNYIFNKKDIVFSFLGLTILKKEKISDALIYEKLTAYIEKKKIKVNDIVSLYEKLKQQVLEKENFNLGEIDNLISKLVEEFFPKAQDQISLEMSNSFFNFFYDYPTLTVLGTIAVISLFFYISNSARQTFDLNTQLGNLFNHYDHYDYDELEIIQQILNLVIVENIVTLQLVAIVVDQHQQISLLEKFQNINILPVLPTVVELEHDPKITELQKIQNERIIPR